MDKRVEDLADILVNYSANVQKGETVQIVGGAFAEELIKACYVRVLRKGAFPRVHVGLEGMGYLYYKNARDMHMKHFPSLEMAEMKKTDAVIYIGGSMNKRELSSIDPKKMALRQKVMRPISKYRVKHTKWVLCIHPTASYAQDADMSLAEFEDFVYNATNLDWKAFGQTYSKKQKTLQKAKTIRIKAAGTDLTMSVAGMKFVLGAGQHNMPCGEIFTAPVADSVNGRIVYEWPQVYGGREVEGITLEFKDGKVVKSTATKNEAYLKQMIAMDKGSCYVGELGIGTNYRIQKYIKNILFDEKIGGTVHLALGQAYEDCNGKNASALHWDMIKDLRVGGELIADGKVVQRNGKFLI